LAYQKIESPDQEGVQNKVGDNPSAEYDEKEDRELTKEEEARLREQLDKKIAKSKEAEIKSFTDISLGRHPAKIQDIRFKKDQLLLRISLPFLLLPPSEEPGEHPYPRSEQKRIRRAFAKHLKEKNNAKRLANFFYTQLVDFLIGVCGLKKPNPAIETQLQNIAQRNLAGRPAQGISRKASG
jgi:hypothetical protein